MVGLLALLLLGGFVLVAMLAFYSLVARRIASDAGRVLAVGLCFVVALAGGAWGALALVFSAAFSYPTTTHPINTTYYFTQQEYGFVTMRSRGYRLTFYRQRPFWLDQKLGEVQLECAGSEVIVATAAPVEGERIRLRLAAADQQRLDTTLGVAPPFDFRRTFEDRTLDFSKRP